MMTLAELKKHAQNRRCTMRCVDGEYRVAYELAHYTAHLDYKTAIEKQEDQAVYCTDRQEAFDNINAIADARDKAQAMYPEHGQ